MFDIRADALTDPQTLSLIAFHQSGMRSDSPEGKCYALDLTALAAPGITVWSAWAGERIAAIGALRRWPGEALGEIKSMRTHPDFLRQGAGARILDTIVTAARNEGLLRLALETGSGPAFAPALKLYRRRGFLSGGPFGDYISNGFNQFLWLDLQSA